MKVIPKILEGNDPIYLSKTYNQNGCFMVMLKQYEKVIDLFHKSIAYRPFYYAA